MKIWRNSKLDALMLIFSIIQLLSMIFFATQWNDASISGKLGGFFILTFMMTYNIIVISHLFTHVPWFHSATLNAFVSLLNTINIGQSVQIYHLTHVRNHHRYNNDQKGADGKTLDFSSTFQDGKNNEHATLFKYALLGGLSSLKNTLKELLTLSRLGKVGSQEHKILNLLSRSQEKNRLERKQIQYDRLIHIASIIFFASLSWQWTVYVYLPAFFIALVLVNIQNYYEHYGASPNDKAANSVSYYGKLYNWLTFNDGYHQEHHLKPIAHWRTMPMVRLQYQQELNAVSRIISPVPAIVGFLNRNRKKLHKEVDQIEFINSDEIQDELEEANIANNE